MLKISVLIITRNRENDLDECLNSLSNQSTIPFEIIIIDNDSSDNTREVCKRFGKELPVKYYLEKKIGIPYARNKSIKKAEGEILAFLDDDCIASKTWIQNIKKRFGEDRKLDALAGLSKSYWNEPIPLIEQFYYERWILSITGSLIKKAVMIKVLFFDFKNCAIKKNVIMKMPKLFSTTVPFGDVGDEDTEFIQRLNSFCKKAAFDPKILVYHKNSRKLKRLISRNFYHGISQYLLFSKEGNTFQKNIDKISLNEFAELAKRNVALVKNSFLKFGFIFLVLVHPFSYKAGRLYAEAYIKLKRNYKMPSR